MSVQTRYLVSMPLESVRRPAAVADRWGAYEMVLTDEGFTFHDELIDALIVPLGGSFTFSVSNLSEHTIFLVWDESTYVDTRGVASGLSSGDTRLIEVGQSRPPATIPAGARIEETGVPNNHIDGSEVSGFFPYAEDPSTEIGEFVRLVLPIRVEDVINEYTFVFEVDGVSGTDYQCGGLVQNCITSRGSMAAPFGSGSVTSRSYESMTRAEQCALIRGPRPKDCPEPF